MRARSAIAVVLAGVLLALVGCDDETPRGTDPTAAGADFVVSYAGAAGRLAGLEATEDRAQVLDWARIGLAANLGLDTGQVRNALYDAVPVRDGGFSDLSRQATGPGRALFDGKVLHLLVAADDPRRARTVGQLLDQHRTDAGGDPEQVRVHDFTVHADSRTVDVTAEEPTSADQARSANGYVSARVDQAGGLTEFLARTRSLSTLEVRGTEVWAGGWTWPDEGAPLALADVSALQRGYRPTSGGPTPAFSLDPRPAKTTADLVAAVPGLSGETAERVLSGNWSGTAFTSSAEVAEVVADVLHGDGQADALAQHGLPTTRESLWGLWSALDGGPVYSQARYDGGLAGTAVGMTLFYTDYVAKNWVNGTGDGVPAKAVEGFVPDPDAVTPWSHCETGLASESGRLWFGQNESAYSYDSAKISIGAQSTRLFSRSDGTAGAEVEPSFASGRGLTWWDQHYQAVADHEPQYQRLDQIMRWSGALEWLAAKTSATLPHLPDAEIPSTLTFADWYAKNPDLRERAPVRFVTPPSAEQEAVVVTPSKSYESCGYRVISGGVSLGDLIARKGTADYLATLPAPVNRAGLLDASSTFDATTGTGSVKRLSIDSAGQVVANQEHAFRTVDGKAVVDVTAAGRKVVRFGDLKLVLPDTAQRRLSTTIDAHDGHVSQRVDYEGREFGELTADRDATLVTVTWRRGFVDRVRGVLDSVQKTLAAAPEGVPSAKDGVLYTLKDPAGRVVNRVGGADAPWLSISGDVPPAGDAPVFRLGAPNPGASGPRFFYGEMVAPPTVPPGRSLDVAPATPDGPAVATFTDGPPADAKTVRVTVRDGRSADAYLVGDHVRADPSDPILGVNGLAEGAAVLREMPRIVIARADATLAEDGLWRGVRLGEDGAALVNDTEVRIVSGDDPWSAKVLRAIGTDPEQTVLVRLTSDRAVVVDKSDLAEVPGSRAEAMDLGQALQTPDADLYLHESFRASLSLEDGRVIAGSLPRDTKVKVRRATAEKRTSVPYADVRAGNGMGRGAEWLRIPVSPRAVSGNTSQSPAPTPSAPPGGTAAPVAAGGLVLLICPETGDTLVGCGA
ncbi:hypothetical protein ACFFQW_18195 [Umezawaea endophytica]|uniref:Uncharacterized protein n=1 Tax=Umezawaea endophytica TaxID=1654476 RepID=A0A9X3AFN1_9PSEU|nr:hypothetical protein [Umezawaea endophytica]MCS7478531.1 hypothetical protein [Umezawaea endophytica]